MNDGFKLDFVVIGSRKCATSWLYQLFLRHPDVCVSPVLKQSGYFGRNRFKGLDWYISLYASCQPGQLRGEIDPDLIAVPEAPARIAELSPGARIIAIFRNPPDHFFSSYEHYRGAGLMELPPAEAWQQDPMYRNELSYGSMLQRIYASFPKEQVLVLFFEDIERDSRRVLTAISRFLGIRDEYEPSVVGTRVNAAWSTRYRWLAAIFTHGAGIARRFDLHALVDWVKTWPVIKRNYEVRDRSQVQADRQGELRRRILSEMTGELRQFQQLTGVDVGAIWPETRAVMNA